MPERIRSLQDEIFAVVQAVEAHQPLDEIDIHVSVQRDLHDIPITLRYDGNEEKFDAAMFLAFNGNSAGQFKLARTANVEDGKLDILVLDYKRRVRTCWNMVNYLISHDSEAVHHLQCQKLELHCDIDEETDIDGQPGPRMPLSIECLAGALKIKA